MEQIRRVLVALDLEPEDGSLTPGSRRAAEQALWLAPHLGAPVTVFHSTAEAGAPEAPGGAPSRALPPGGEAALEAVRSGLRDTGVEAEVVISTQEPWFGIVQHLLRHGVDLVVAGKRNAERDDGRRLGSTSQRLLHNCPCAVWVVKPGSVGPLMRVLAATDLTAVGDAVIRWAAFVAERCETQLDVVHAIQLPFDVQWGGEASEADYERRQVEAAQGRVRALLEEAGHRGEPSWHMGITTPSRAILQCVERLDPDLVVMGTVSRGGIAGLVLGNTAERLLERLDCSLLTVKPEDFVCPVELEEAGA